MSGPTMCYSTIGRIYLTEEMNICFSHLHNMSSADESVDIQ